MRVLAVVCTHRFAVSFVLCAESPQEIAFSFIELGIRFEVPAAAVRTLGQHALPKTDIQRCH